MVKNSKMVYWAMGTSSFLVFVTLVSSLLLFPRVTQQTFSIVILVFGVLELGAIFLSGYFLKTDASMETDDEDDKYFQSLVPKAQENPVAFGIKIRRLVLMSKVYMGLLFISCIQTIVGTIFLGISIQVPAKIMLVVTVALGAVVLLLFRALLYHPAFPEYPSEIEATPASFPTLFSIVYRVQKMTKAPKLHHVYVVSGDNCAVAMYTDFFGFRKKNIMEIGISLISFCTEDDLEALLAHEMAHIGNRDTFVGYQANINMLRWDFLRVKVEKENQFIRFLLGKFASFYTKYLSVHMAAISKPHEYAADTVAAKVTSAHQYAAMLYKILYLSEVKTDSLDFFNIHSIEELPTDFLSSTLNQIRHYKNPSPADFQRTLKQTQSMIYDSHPTFFERLKNLGLEDYETQFDLAQTTPIDEGVAQILTFYNQQWHQEMVEEWKSYQEEKKQDEALVKKFPQDYDDVRTCMMTGWALLRLRRREDAISLFQKLTDLYPDADFPVYAVGVARLQNGDESGLEAVMNFADTHAYEIEDAIDTIVHYFVSANQADRLDELQEWFDQKQIIQREYKRELLEIRSTDLFLWADTPSWEIMGPFCEKLSRLKRIKAIYFMRKKCIYAEMGPLLVGIDVGMADTNKSDVEQVEALLDEIMPELNYEGYITKTYENDMGFFLKHFMGSKGNEVYNRRSYLKQMKEENEEN